MPPKPAAFRYVQLLILAGLVGNAAAGLAGRLAGSLAFAATAILRAITQIAGLDGLNMFHGYNLHKNVLFNVITFPGQCQHAGEIFTAFIAQAS